VWLLLLGLWLFCILLWSLSQRPRLLIYGGATPRVEEAVRAILGRCDPEATWWGHVVRLPGWGIELTVESRSGVDVVELESTTSPQRFENWSKLYQVLRRELRELPADRSLLGLRCLAIGMALIGLVAWGLVSAPGSVWTELTNMFQI
jgi:hypothetical protein